MQNTRALVSAMFLVFIAITAVAAPAKLTPELQNKIIFNMNEDESVKVLVLYEEAQSPSSKRLRGAPLVQFLKKQTSLIENEVLKSQVTVLKADSTLWLINASVITMNLSQIEELSQHPLVKEISLLNRKPELLENGKSEEFSAQVESAPETTTGSGYTYGLEKMNVPALRTKYFGLDGRGVSVGIIDTGLDVTHSEFVNKLRLFKDFSSKKSEIPLDDHGHGSHVAGTIVGGADSGTMIGVAPGATLVIAKAFDAGGRTTEEALLQSLQWMADPDGDSATADAPRVISNSWGIGGTATTKDPAADPFCMAIENLKKLGISSIFAGGNDGPTTSSIRIPGACPGAVTVGATDSTDKLASFSSRGPAKWKTVELIKPDISAPGVDIYSVKKGGGYVNNSGTSMATPHIAGALAVLIQARPESSPEELSKALYDGAKDLGAQGFDSQFGHGRADVLKSVELLKSSSMLF